MRKIIYIFVGVMLFSCQEKKTKKFKIEKFQATSFLNDSLFSKQIDLEKDSLRIKKYKDALKKYEVDTN